jgi:hypothetical protein
MLKEMLMASREEIESILQAEVERTIACQQDAGIQYRKILDELAHGSPSSEDIDRLDKAVETELAARAAMWSALVRFTDFSKKGTIPDDLQGNCQTGHDTSPPGHPGDGAEPSRKRGLASHG